MSREKIVAGNWKMNMNYKGAQDLLHAIVANLSGVDNVKTILAPPALYLSEFANIVENHDNLYIGAQTVSSFDNGAYTGEVSAEMLASINAEFCIVGHSERRSYFKESNADIHQKIEKLLQVGINPILCIGETLEERESGTYETVLRTQLQVALKGYTAEQLLNTVIAYEPVWAIGTGKTATPEIAQETHAFVRKVLSEIIAPTFAAKTPILYGGSCNPANADVLFACPDIDGGLIGGAALKPVDFIQLIQAASK